MAPKLKIVITNDDGYDQPGLSVLVEALSPFGEIIVIAPATAQSNIGHQVTMKAPIRVDRIDEGMFVIHATPADCTRLAVKQLVPDLDWLVAGINPGANLGSDVYQSGTVAAAREAAILGVRAAAVSQYIAADWTVDWTAALRQAGRCLPEIMQLPLAPGQFWNVNLPSPITADDTPALQRCPLDRNPHRYRFNRRNGWYHYEGVIHDRPRTKGSDVDICFNGMISLTRMEV